MAVKRQKEQETSIYKMVRLHTEEKLGKGTQPWAGEFRVGVGHVSQDDSVTGTGNAEKG